MKNPALGKEASESRIYFLREKSVYFFLTVTFSRSVVLFDYVPLDSSVYSYGNQVSRWSQGLEEALRRNIRRVQPQSK